MKKFLMFSVLTLAWVTLLWTERASTSANDEAEIRQLLDRWSKAFRARDLKAIMSTYAPGEALVEFDIVPPLKYVGSDAYKKTIRTSSPNIRARSMLRFAT
jgi:ketosteroid isomerase-like protein